MKDFLLLNYNFKVDNIFEKENKKYFFVNDNKIFIEETNENENMLLNIVKVSNYIYELNGMINTIIIDKNNKIYNIYNGKKIILIRDNSFMKETNSSKYTDINKFDIKKYDVNYEFKKTIDNLEKRISEYNNEYMLIQESINYYIGMAENTIQLLNYLNIEYNYIYKKVNICDYEKEYFNPLIINKGSKYLDFSNFVKYSYFYNNKTCEELEEIISNIKTEKELKELFIYLLFPNYYFEVIEKIIYNEIEEKELKKIIDKKDNYIKLLKYIKRMIKNDSMINLIYWF